MGTYRVKYKMKGQSTKEIEVQASSGQQAQKNVKDMMGPNCENSSAGILIPGKWNLEYRSHHTQPETTTFKGGFFVPYFFPKLAAFKNKISLEMNPNALWIVLHNMNPQQLLCTYAACTNILYCRDYHRLHFGPIGNFGWCQRQIHRRRITLGDHLVAGAADCFRSLLFARHFRIVRRGLKFSARGLTCFWMWNRRVEVKVKAHASFAYLL